MCLLHRHATKEARRDGEDQRRLHLLQSWHETNGASEAAATFRVLDGLPCLVPREGDGHLQTLTLVVDGGLVTAILLQRNPDKPARFGAALAGTSESGDQGQGTGSP